MLSNIQKRFLYFLIGCIGTRTMLVFLAKDIPNTYLPYMGYLAIPISLGFFYNFFTGSRKTGPEVFGDKIWWNNLRPLHGLLYLEFAYFAIHKNPNAWIVLLIDVIFGFTSFFIFHYLQGNFEKLLE
jgi:hypothetical protein